MSSDSDDDCYGKIAQKLQSMKSNYQGDKIKTKKLLDDSSDVSLKNNLTTKENELPATSLNQANYDVDDTKEITLDSIIEQNSKKRKTRSRTKKDNDDVSYVPDEPVGRGRRRQSKRSLQATERLAARFTELVSQASAYLAGNSSTSTGRGSTPSRRRGARGSGRGRGRGRNKGGQNKTTYNQNNLGTNNFNIFHYSVGNTSEYEDLSDKQDIFPDKPADVIIIDDNLDNTFDDPLDNEELSVKVYWQSSEIFKFPLRRFQKFTQIYDYFASKENVTKEKLFFTYNDVVLNAEDTPETIKYNICKFIDGGIVNQSLSPLKKKPKHEIINGIKLKFQCQNMKKPYETVIQSDEKLSIVFMKCAEHLEKPIEKLKFYFDGDLISGKNTANDLELEGGECIDVVIIS